MTDESERKVQGHADDGKDGIYQIHHQLNLFYTVSTMLVQKDFDTYFDVRD